MSRIGKQLVYGLIYAGALAAFAGFFYASFLRSAPGCENGRRDADEEGVDCGGACRNACLPAELRVIEQAGTVRIFRGTPGTLEAAVKIQNANTEFAARYFSYRLAVFDESGAQVDAVSGSSYIYAGEIKYLTAIKTGIAYRAASAELSIENPLWVPAGDWPRPATSAVQDRKIESSSSSIAIGGSITNQDAVTFSSVTVTALFYGAFGTPLGVSQTELEDVRPEERRTFRVLHPPLLDVAPERTELAVTALRP